MRWETKVKHCPWHGDQRTRKKFFWWPTEVQGTTYWLETRLITETYYTDYTYYGYGYGWCITRIED